MSVREGKETRPAWLLGGGLAALTLAASAQAALVTISDVVTNTTATTQSYEFKQTIKVTESIASVAIRGNISFVLSDFTGDGASLTADNGNLYSGWMNAVQVKSFVPQNNVTSFGVTAPVMGMSMYNGSYGKPTPEATGRSLAVNDTIEIRFNFRLSAGDQAAFTGTFELVPAGAIPGPGVLATALLAPWIGLHRRRRTENGR